MSVFCVISSHHQQYNSSTTPLLALLQLLQRDAVFRPTAQAGRDVEPLPAAHTRSADHGEPGNTVVVPRLELAVVAVFSELFHFRLP